MKIKVSILNISTGHKQHKSGAGKHGDKRQKRNKTREAQLRRELLFRN